MTNKKAGLKFRIKRSHKYEEGGGTAQHFFFTFVDELEKPLFNK